jgi:hypothetical protein
MPLPSGVPHTANAAFNQRTGELSNLRMYARGNAVGTVNVDDYCWRCIDNRDLNRVIVFLDPIVAQFPFTLELAQNLREGHR